VPATVIVGAQWGDEGKGKIVDLLAQHSDVVCRYQGGPNAGHTIVVGDETYKIRALPSGIVRGKPCVIGNGCVVDPEVLIGELDEFERRGHPTDEVRVSGNAHLIMPWHVAIDGASERRLGKLAIGTTRRGIGPCYADKAMRLGIRVQDILDPKILRQKIEAALAEKNLWLERVYETEAFELETVASQYESYAQRLRPYVADTSLYVDTALQEEKVVLFEGAQATLLDLDHGTYPFVTSSNPVAANAATGVGIGPQRIDRVIGVAKAYVTRVGEGPFPTEMDEPWQSRVREIGHEFGTVTGRERRCGWLDLVALRYAVRVNGIDQLALTKLDVLSEFAALPVCTRYRLRDGSETRDFPAHQSDFHAARPVYGTLPGWQEPLDGCAAMADLPDAARRYVDGVEQELGVEVTLVGTGADRERILSPRSLEAVARP
jgi:adenylosuccinate synthase